MYENAKNYKEKRNKWHDRHIIRSTFELEQEVLIFNSHHKHFPFKLQFKWSRPYTVVSMTPHGVVELCNEAAN